MAFLPKNGMEYLILPGELFIRPLTVTSSVLVDAWISVHYPPYRVLSVTDVDKVIVLPVNLQVDARDYALITDEDVMTNYDVLTSVTAESDYVLYACLPKSKMFNQDFTWKYQSIRSPITGEIHLVDAGVTDSNKPILDTVNMADELALGANTSTRFMHYKQAYSFFKYSFPVGDSFTMSSADAALSLDDNSIVQLYAVYLDSSGHPCPYMTSTPSSYAPHGETDIIFRISNVPSGLYPAPIFRDPDTGLIHAIDTIICPPDPDFLSHGPLVMQCIDGDYVIRNVYGKPSYSKENFQYYDQTSGIDLLLYYLVKPPQQHSHKGDALFVCYVTGDNIPKRDGTSLAKHPNLQKLSQVFTLKDNEARPVPRQVYSLHSSGATCPSPRLHMPIAFFSVKHSDSQAGLSDMLPFQYESLNMVPFTEPRKRNIGSRLIQLVSEYLFDASTEHELQFFPFLMEESYSIVKKIVAQLSESLQTSSTIRTQILRQLLVKHGRRYFEEYSQMIGSSEGDVRSVVSKINEFFLFFTVSLRTHVSFRTKNTTEAITLQEIPIVLHIVDG